MGSAVHSITKRVNIMAHVNDIVAKRGEVQYLSLMRNIGEKGFTLLEVMISLVILAVGILGVVGMFVSAIGGNSQGRNMTEASNLAQSRLDYEMNATPYTNMTTGSEVNGKYNISWRKTQPVAAIGSGLKQVTVTVTWNTKGQTHKVECSSLRAKS